MGRKRKATAQPPANGRKLSAWERLAIHGLDSWLFPTASASPAEWIEANIDLSLDSTAAIPERVSLARTPYLVDVVNAWDQRRAPGRLRITVMAPEQTAKTSAWMWPFLWTLAEDPGPALVVWQNDDIAADTNRDRLEPLMAGVPRLAAELASPGSHRRDAYRFRDSITYFTGAGSPVLSRPCRRVIGDEADFWNLPNQSGNRSATTGEDAANVSNIRNLDKRTTTYASSLRYLGSSPRLPTGPIATEFGKSSQGHWHLRCVACEALTASHDMRPLQFRHVDGAIDRDSIRWVCPACHYEHEEHERQAMNERGAFVHLHPERMPFHLGFQWSKLASPFVPWIEIAQAIIEGGKTGDLDAQMFLDQSIRGLPFKRRMAAGDHRDSLFAHCRPWPEAEKIKHVLFAADTQDAGWYWVARGLDANRNSYLLAHGFAGDSATLLREFQAERSGRKAAYGIIDEGGHRTPEVDRIVAATARLYAYRGNPRIGLPAEWSRNKGRLILANPGIFQHRLLWYMYHQHDETAQYWALPPEIDDEYLGHLLACRPPKTRPNADFSRWACPEGAANHYFDCEKMLQVLMYVFKLTANAGPAPAKSGGATRRPSVTIT